MKRPQGMAARALLYGGVAALVGGAVAVPVASAASGCTPQVLDMGANGNIVGDNGRNTFVGWVANKSGENRAMLFRADGSRVDLGIANATAVDMNSTGIVVGNAEQGSPDEHAFAWYHGRAVRLPEPSWAVGDFVRRVNDRGDAAGAVFDHKGHSHPAVWVRLTFVHVLPIPKGFTDAEALGINNRGEMVGDSDHPQKNPVDPIEQEAWWWRENGSNGPLRPDYRGGFAEANVVNQRDWAAGGLDYGGRIGLWAAVWRNGSVTRLGPTGRGVQFSFAYAGDQQGDYAGAATYTPQDQLLHVFLTRIGTHVLYTMRPLSGNLQDGSGAFALIPHDGAYGTVAGGLSHTADGSEHATLWTCAWQQAIRPPVGPAMSSGASAGRAPTFGQGVDRMRLIAQPGA